MSDYILTFRDRENVHYLSKAGRERVGTDVVRTKISPVDHYLMRNDLYISKKPELFKPEQRIKVGELTIVADAIMKFNQAYYFVEIDNSQRMVNNRVKIDKYRKLKETGAFQKQYGYFPRICWVTSLESRRRVLEGLLDGLDHIIYTWEEIL